MQNIPLSTSGILSAKQSQNIGAPPRDTPGLTQMAAAPRPWTFHKNGSAQKKQWLYSGDTKVFVIKIMLISLFSPGARQSFFSTIIQSAGHRSVYLHCVWKVHTLKSFEVTGDLDGSRSQDSRLPQKSSGLPWFTQAYPLEGCHFSGERGRALRAPRRPRRLIFSRRPRRPGDPRLSPLASEDIKNDDGQGPQLS